MLLSLNDPLQTEKKGGKGAPNKAISPKEVMWKSSPLI